MSWTLLFATPPGPLLYREFSELTSPPVTIDAPTMQVDPPGDCIQMDLLVGAPQSLAVKPRDIIRYLENDQALFAGVVVTCPSPDSMGAGPADDDADALQRITALGGRALVEASTCGPLFISEQTDIATIAYKFCDAYANSALGVDSDNFPDTTVTMPICYAPYRQLSDLLDDLTSKVTGGASWWVDAELQIHFKADT